MSYIHKHELRASVTVESLPKGTVVLSTAEQNGKIVVWVLKPDIQTFEENKTTYTFYAYNTSSEYINVEFKQFIGTVQMDNGIVWHIFVEVAA